uniref:Glutaredoxin domain-containing protein n=1 Tax=Kalanchoe fedtschenkoi TaxID=63787 RepID=A0A7N0V141_KALFE
MSSRGFQLSRITNIPHSGRIRSLYTSRACEECGRHTSDCLHVRLVLKGLGLRVDERDLSMHSCFKDELKQLMRDAFDQRTPASPRVFIGQKYVAGADEIRRLNEEAQLEKVSSKAASGVNEVSQAPMVTKRVVPAETRGSSPASPAREVARFTMIAMATQIVSSTRQTDGDGDGFGS